MSLISLSPNASGTGVFTVASPNSNTDRVLTLPDETGTVDTLQRSGNVIQVVNFQTGAVATGTTVMPGDDTIPQITEGNQYMSLAITPTNADNILIIEVGLFAATSVASAFIIALFVGDTANALAATSTVHNDVNGWDPGAIAYHMVAGVTTELTFRVRAGLNTSNTTTFNGRLAGGLFGGSLKSFITITEYAA